MAEIIDVAVIGEAAGQRLDVFLANQCPDYSRSHIQKLIEEGLVQVNHRPGKGNYRMRAGDQVTFQVPDPVDLTVEPEAIPLEIYYEDTDLIVVNKPQGMVVHPAEGNYSGTLVNALLYHCHDLSGINGVLRPGIVHRIDKDTSGLLVAAKNDFAHGQLAGLFKEHSVTRVYTALVHGEINEEKGMINAPIGRDPRDRQKMAVVARNAKAAVTHYQVQQRFKGYTLINARLETGRTHQIRVHMAYLKHPVVGDPKYGPARVHFDLSGQLLHAAVLGFPHPRTGVYLEWQAPLPERFQAVLAELGGLLK